MPTQLACPNPLCGRRFEVVDKAPGEAVICPGCGARFALPAAAEASPPSPPAKPPVEALAVVACVLGATGLVCCPLGWIGLPLALVALGRLRRAGPSRRGRALAWIGLGLCLVPLLYLAAGVAVALDALEEEYDEIRGKPAESAPALPAPEYPLVRFRYLGDWLRREAPDGRYLMLLDGRPNALPIATQLDCFAGLTVAARRTVESPLTAAEWDRLIEANPQATHVVSLVGLAADWPAMRYWLQRPAERPRLVLVDAILAPHRRHLADGTILAAVVDRPDPIPDDTPGPLPPLEEQFQRRYLLVHAGNLDELARRYPLFDPAP